MPIFKLVKNPIPLLYGEKIFMLKIENDDIRYRVIKWPQSANGYTYSIEWKPFPFPLEVCEILSKDFDSYIIANNELTECLLKISLKISEKYCNKKNERS